jgi:hypothetical protein
MLYSLWKSDVLGILLPINGYFYKKLQKYIGFGSMTF